MAGGRIRVGIGGWTFAPWRGRFYPAGLPQKDELTYASERMTSIEVNGTFYRSQKPETFAGWREAAPGGFVFALKAPRFATNRRVLAEAEPSIERFTESGISELGDKLGPINWQFAPTKRFEREDFARFLELLPARIGDRPLRHAVEVRHESFRSPDFVTLARDHGVAVVLAGDAPYPEIAEATADFAYIRIMGTREEEAEGYAPAELDGWAERARGLAEDPNGSAGRDVFLYVISGFKPANPAAATALMARLG